MKEMELRNYATCSLCRKKIGAAAIPIFYRVTVEAFGVDLGAVQRQQGLAMMLGGSALLAHHMGAHEEMATSITGEATVLSVCATCAPAYEVCIGQLVELPNVEKLKEDTQS